ncbi:MAG: stage II sporulation protein M [Euryarchaeota archaeon]|nr:stage II sporulation protein M [Euryarchaeota archaeon]
MLKKDRYEDFFQGLYNRNERFLMISAAIFVMSLFIGYFLSGLLEQFLGNMFKDFQRSISEREIQLNTFSLFIHNLKTVFLIYAGGLLIGVGSAILIFTNGVFIGYVASKVPFSDFVIYTAPHGIFEVLGIIIVGAAGFRLASALVNFVNGMIYQTWYGSISEKIRYVFYQNLDEFQESLILFAITVVLFFIAAIIEANVTLAWVNYMKGVT